MGSEDFQEAFKPLNTPYAFILVGVAPPELFAKAVAAGKPFPYSNHNPDFFVDLAAIPLGAKVDTVAALSVSCKTQVAFESWFEPSRQLEHSNLISTPAIRFERRGRAVGKPPTESGRHAVGHEKGLGGFGPGRLLPSPARSARHLAPYTCPAL